MFSKRRAYPDFETFWQHFLTSHTRGSTRWAHAIGVSMGIFGLGYSVVLGQIWPALFCGVVFVVLVFGSHPVLEGNRPENLGYPLWGGRALLRLTWRTLSGQVNAEVERIK